MAEGNLPSDLIWGLLIYLVSWATFIALIGLYFYIKDFREIRSHSETIEKLLEPPRISGNGKEIGPEQGA